jgi:sugar O-acyltransferase (sialic acid O-acetyltransferase NeuD family)
MNHLIVIGGGGHAKSCIDVISHSEEYSISGINDPKLSTSPFPNIPLIPGSLQELFLKNQSVFLGIGFIKNPKPRQKLINQIIELGFKTPSFFSPFAYSSSNSHICEGTIIMHQAIINTHVEIGPFCIINSKSLIEHDVQIASNCHISTGAIVNGGSRVGANTFIGSNAVIGNNISIGENCIVQAGAFLNRDLKNNEIYKV